MRLKADQLAQNGIKDRLNNPKEIQIKKFVHVFEVITLNCFIKRQRVFGRVPITLFTQDGDKRDDECDKGL